MRAIRCALAQVIVAIFILGSELGHANAGPTQTANVPAAKPNDQLPNNFRLNLLIRTTLIALTQANATGNYTVLRDLASPSFQQANNPARLAELFANLRARNIDLSPILFFEPKLIRAPAIQPNGHLRLSGYFETKPEQVNFDLAFEQFGSEWRLFGIAVETRAPTPVGAGTGPAAVSQGETGTAAKSSSATPASSGTAASNSTKGATAKKSPAKPQ